MSYLPPLVNADRRAAHLLEHLAAPSTWAWVWLAVGLLALTAAAARRLRPLAVGASIGIYILWATSFTLIGGRGWVSALSYGSVALLALWAFSRGRMTEVPPLPKMKEARDLGDK
ncbi:hypothetical protein ACUY2E_10205 [Corynebacterium confusum]